MLWWRSNKEPKKRSIFRLPGRARPEPESALRIPLPGALPEKPRILPAVRGYPEPLQWLMRSSAHIPEAVTSIDLLSIHDRIGNQVDLDGGGGEPGESLGVKARREAVSQEDAIPSLEDRLRILLAAPLEIYLSGEDGVLEWPGELMPFQSDGVRILLESDRILLADDMGLGKTIQVIAALRILLVQRRIATALIVTPVSLLDQWRNELAKWAPEIRAMIIRGSPSERQWLWESTDQVHIAFVGYQTLLSDYSSSTHSVVGQKTWDVVVIDEAQRIKNRNDTSAAVKGLKRHKSWALTGTPIENRVEELASIMEFVDHHELNGARHYQPGPELEQRHRELQLRRKKGDVLPDLPPKQITKLKMALSPKQQESYDKAETDGVVHLRELGREVNVAHVLELITRLKQICNADPETGASCKFDDIKERIGVLVVQGHKALVFSQYTSDAFGVRAAVKALEDFEPLRLVGGTSEAERRAVIQRFKEVDRHKVFVISLEAGGVGLNLQEASYVFHLDRWWNPAKERQAEDRVHRIGQTVPVNVIKYSCIGTIEERIDAILESKQDLFDRLIDDVSIDVSKNLTGDELFGLFGLTPTYKRSSKDSSTESRPSGLELESRCAAILEQKGYVVKKTPRSRDGGIDLIGSMTDEVGITQELYIQCKDHARPVGVEVIRELIGVIPVEGNVIPVLASPSGVTSDARKTAEARQVEIWDEEKLSELEALGKM